MTERTLHENSILRFDSDKVMFITDIIKKRYVYIDGYPYCISALESMEEVLNIIDKNKFIQLHGNNNDCRRCCLNINFIKDILLCNEGSKILTKGKYNRYALFAKESPEELNALIQKVRKIKNKMKD